MPLLRGGTAHQLSARLPQRDGLKTPGAAGCSVRRTQAMKGKGKGAFNAYAGYGGAMAASALSTHGNERRTSHKYQRERSNNNSFFSDSRSQLSDLVELH